MPTPPTRSGRTRFKSLLIAGSVALSFAAVAYALNVGDTKDFDSNSTGAYTATDATVTGSATVVANTVTGTGNALLLTPGLPPGAVSYQVAGGSSSTYWVDFKVSPQATSGSGVFADADGARLSFRATGSGQASFYAYNGDGAGSWSSVGTPLTLAGDATPGRLVRVTLRVDYATKHYDVFLDGTLVAVDLGLADDNVAVPTTLGFFSLSDADTLVDDIAILTGAPSDMASGVNLPGAVTVVRGGSSATVQWTGASGVTYNIERRVEGGTYSSLGQVTSGTSFADTGLSAGTLYYYRVSAVNAGGLALAADEVSTAAVSADLTVTAGRRLWLSADNANADGSGNLTAWPDGSGRANDPSASGTATVVSSALNGHPVVHLSGGQFFYLPNFMSGATQGEVYAVIKSAFAYDWNYHSLWYFSPSTNYYPNWNGALSESFGFQASVDFVSYTDITQPHLYSVSSGAGRMTVRQNGIKAVDQPVSAAAGFVSSPRLGGGNGNFNGDIAELLVYDHVLSDTERVKVTHYLATKYALTLPAAVTPTNLGVSRTGDHRVTVTWNGSLQGTTFVLERALSGGAFSTLATIDGATVYDDTTADAAQAYDYRISTVAPDGSTSAPTAAVTLAAEAAGQSLSDMPVTGMRLWLSADASMPSASGTLMRWTDRSGSGNNLVLPANAQPSVVTNAMNGRPVVRFAGAQNVDLPNFMSGASSGEVFAVVKSAFTSDGNYHSLWTLSPNSNYYPYWNGTLGESFGFTSASVSFASCTDISQPHLYAVSANAGRMTVRQNGIKAVDQSLLGSVGFSTNPRIGSGNGNFNGDVAEIIVYDHALTDAERTAVSRYLTTKYAIALAPAVTPTDFAVNRASDHRVTLTWSGSLQGTGFIIERRLVGGTFAAIATVEGATTFDDTSADPTQAYEYRISATGPDGSTSAPTSVVSLAAEAAGQSLSDLPTTGMRLWLSADVAQPTPSGVLIGWPDRSGSGNNGTIPSYGTPPAFVTGAMNGRPVLRFTGSQSINLPNLMSGTSSGEVFTVLKAASAYDGNYHSLWNFSPGGSYYPKGDYSLAESFGFSTPVPFMAAVDITQPHLYNVASGAGRMAVRHNGMKTVDQAVSGSPGFGTTPSIGGTFNGDIAEVLVYDHTLTDVERAAVNRYLTGKYAIALVAATTPTSLAVTRVGDHQAMLTWSGANPACRFLIERRASGGTFASLATVDTLGSYIDGTVDPAVSYDYRVSALDAAAGASAPSTTVSLAAESSGTSMGDIPVFGAKLWLVADGARPDVRGKLNYWSDSSPSAATGMTYDFNLFSNYQASVVANGLNGRPVVHFSGGQPIELPNFMNGASEGEVFAVLKADSTSDGTDHSLWSFSTYGATYPQNQGVLSESFGFQSYQVNYTTCTDISQAHIYSVSSGAGRMVVRQNGVTALNNAGQGAPGFNASPRLGSTFKGDIAEVVVFDHVLSDVERAAMNRYLATKYGIALPVATTPTAVAISRIGDHQASLTWASAIAGMKFLIERRVAGGSFAALATVLERTVYMDTSLDPYTTYEYRVTATGPDNVASAPSSGVSLSAETIGTTLPDMPMTGLRVWLSADAARADASGKVDFWPDLSAAGNDAPMGQIWSPVLVSNAMNGRPVVRFSGQSIGLPDVMQGTTQGEIFVVAKSAFLDDGSQHSLFVFNTYTSSYPGGNGVMTESFGFQSYPQQFYPVADITAPHIYNVASGSGIMAIRQNGSLVVNNLGVPILGLPGSGSAGFVATPTIGTNFKGDIAEVLVFDHVLTPVERESVNRYLNTKYALLASSSFREYADDSGSGLTNAQVAQAGYAIGNLDFDGDGVSNYEERLRGTSMFVPDAAPPAGDPDDHAAPVITLRTPAGATPVN